MNDQRRGNASLQHDAELARLDDLLTQALRLASAVPGRRASTQPPMTAPLAEACRVAHARALPPERVIVLLKGAWERVRDTDFPTRNEAQLALERAVTVCVQQYFTDHADGDECQTLKPR